MIVRAFAAFLALSSIIVAQPAGRRILILKVDGLNADLLFKTMRQIDPETGRSELPWMERIFDNNGAVFENFYTRGISLSAPSWSELDTGHHTVIRGNVEFDRYTGHVYDYLNFFPFYIAYARLRRADMPGVEVLDRAGIPLLLDRFPYNERYQSFQLYQRGVRWSTLTSVLKRKFSKQALLSLLEGGGPSLDELWEKQTEFEIDHALQNPSIRYLDFFTGDIDHEGHATSDPAAMREALERLDALCGRLWTTIQHGPQAGNTVIVMVSDHGMNNQPGVISQSFSLPDLLNRAEGGGHHVITDRHEFSDFKLSGLDPLVQRVINPSRASLYLKGQADKYPTAWVDLDGNERASIWLRNSDLNKIHILLIQISRHDLKPDIRAAAVADLERTIDRHRAAWSEIAQQLEEELKPLQTEIAETKAQQANYPRKPDAEMRRTGMADEIRRMDERVSAWQRETEEYSAYIRKLRALLALDLSPNKPFEGNIADLVPEMSLGDSNTLFDLQNYIAGPQAELVLNAEGKLDDEKSFVHLNYFDLFAAQTVQNNPQHFDSNPVDFAVLRIPSPAASQVFWLTKDQAHQLLILKNAQGLICLKPVQHLHQNSNGQIEWQGRPWHAGLPLALFEDPALRLPSGADRAAWLSAWHTEREWFDAISQCRYSNGVIGVTEQLSPVADNVPGRPGLNPVLLRYERRRRELVQPDLEVFANDHWNFNVRNVNPGGNHGSFLRISTHSVWMMSGPGIPAAKIQEPHDSLDFAPCLMALANVAHAPESFCEAWVGATPPMH